ncbi:unnamed protein product [Boreogadus saida]
MGKYGAMTALLRELDGPSVPVALLQATDIVDEKPLTLMTEPPHQPPPEKTHPTPTPDNPCTSGHLPGVRAKCLQLLLTALHSQGPPPHRPQEEDEGLARDIEGHIHVLCRPAC